MSDRYRTIVADPPWEQPRGGRHNGSDGRAVLSRPSALPYPMLSAATIAAMGVRDAAERDAHLYLWVTNAHVEDAYPVARAWGFRPSVLLTVALDKEKGERLGSPVS